MSKTIEERIARMESLLESINDNQGNHIKILFRNYRDIDNRVNCLELWRAETKGGWAVLSALGVGSSIFTLIAAKLTGILGG